MRWLWTTALRWRSLPCAFLKCVVLYAHAGTWQRCTVQTLKGLLTTYLPRNQRWLRAVHYIPEFHTGSCRALIVLCKYAQEFHLRHSQARIPTLWPVSCVPNSYTKAWWAAQLKPQPSGIWHKQQWNKEISKHIHKERFSRVLFYVSGTAAKPCHILKLLPWQSVLFYWLWSTLLCLSHVNDQGTKARAHGSPRSIRTALGSFPLDTCHWHSLGRHFFEKASLPGCCKMAFGDIYEICTSFRVHSAGATNAQWWSPCFCLKAKLFL